MYKDNVLSHKVLFRSAVPLNILFGFLEKICLVKPTYYLLDTNSFRTLQYHAEWYSEFMDNVRPYYRTSQQHYTIRTLTYNHLITVIRQICRHHGIVMERTTTYSKDDYNHDYKIKGTY